MSKSSERVNAWRKRTKQRLTDAFGGVCCICGYSRCNTALELHHIDPTQKDFHWGQACANIISWARIVVEVRKCVMLCSNCHKELHAGVTQIPVDAKRFDESYAIYKKPE